MKAFIKLQVLLLVAALAACAPNKQTITQDNKSSSIIGGEIVEPSDLIAKTTVALVGLIENAKGEKSQFICTGSLLTENVVLTAAHCIPVAEAGEKTALFVVFNTELQKLQRADVRVADKTVLHPEYGTANENGEDNHDIALIRFEGQMAEGYQTAQLLPDDSVLVPGTKTILAGYGLTDGVNKTSDDRLRKVDVEIAGNFGETEMILDQRFGKGACHGDSGGPALQVIDGVPYVWGVTSRGIGKEGKDDCSLLSIYTRVQAEKTFVDAALSYLAQ